MTVLDIANETRTIRGLLEGSLQLIQGSVLSPEAAEARIRSCLHNLLIIELKASGQEVVLEADMTDCFAAARRGAPLQRVPAGASQPRSPFRPILATIDGERMP